MCLLGRACPRSQRALTPAPAHPTHPRSAVQTLAASFVMSWSGVVRIHGIRPTPRPGRTAGVFVANHSSMNDFILLLQSHPYAVVGQRHTGWVGFLQKYLLGSLNCLWFDRSLESEKKSAGKIIQQHVHSPANVGTPLLVFPEGTCVNNEYVVQVSAPRPAPPLCAAAPPPRF